ncbi:MAG: TonB-dependent receptor, partial [Gemmatimonadetes bacterium]
MRAAAFDSSRSTLVLLAGLLLALGWGAPPLDAQSRGTSGIRGRVVASDGTPVPDATVQLRHTRTGRSRVAVTNQEGGFLISVLQPGGPYRVTVQHLGFGEYTLEDLQLAVGEVHVLDIVLQEQAVDVEGLEVTVDRTEVFNPSQVGPATRIDEITIESVPIISRNFMDLAVLSPLVKRTENGGFSIAGQNDRYNQILVDGVSNKDVFGLTAGGVPGGQAGAKIIPIDAVAQYEILVAPFDVRLSGFTGGVMNAVTRTGENEWRIRGSAVHRAEALMGDLSLPTGLVDASGVDRTLLALSVGGPVIRDRAHFFITGEFEERHQPPTGFNLERDPSALIRVSPASAGEAIEAFRSQFGLDPGISGPYRLNQQLANVFGRLDWSLTDRSRLTVRNVFARGENDESPNRSAFEPYEFSSNAVFRTSLNNTTSAQLFTDFGARGSNELTLQVQHSRDQTDPASDWPQVELTLISSEAGSAFRRNVRMGSQFFAQENDLRQTNVRLSDALTLINGGSTYTFGATVAYYDFSHRFLPGAKGDYLFASLADLEANAPIRYQRTVLQPGQSPSADFNVLEWGLYAQNQIDAGEGLTMRFGLRVDVPHVLDRPENNPMVEELFGHRTSQVPSGKPLFSPRWGFNWQSPGKRLRTQVRGGAGMFVGQLPFVWLSNAFHNNGLRSVIEVCEGRVTDDPATGNTAPPFDPSAPAPSCVRGAPRQLRQVVLFDEDFRYPQD